jgi:hypothetical protein
MEHRESRFNVSGFGDQWVGFGFAHPPTEILLGGLGNIPNEILLGERSRTPTSAVAARSTLSLSREIGYLISKASSADKLKRACDRTPHPCIGL